MPSGVKVIGLQKKLIRSTSCRDNESLVSSLLDKFIAEDDANLSGAFERSDVLLVPRRKSDEALAVSGIAEGDAWAKSGIRSEDFVFTDSFARTT